MFRKLDLFPSSGEGRETPAPFGPFLTMDQVHKPSDFKKTRSSYYHSTLNYNTSSSD
jgi:hypothetical protein